MKLSHISLALSGLLLLAYCSAGKKNEESISMRSHVVVEQEREEELSRLRADWSGYDFQKTDLAQLPAYFEPKIVSFIEKLKPLTSTESNTAIKTLLDSASQNKEIYTYFIETFGNYLYDANSVLRNDAYYAAVLEHAVASPWMDPDKKTTYRNMLDLVRKNMPGMHVADFAFINKDGAQRRFYELNGEPRLLILYDPVCAPCSEVIQQVAKSQSLATWVDHGTLKVIAVSPVGDLRHWQAYQTNLPRKWVNGFDVSGTIVQERLFDLKMFPTFYLIDEGNHVVLKDTDLQEVLSYMQFNSKQ
ncbi:DUF5106 domain-containing protein [Sphingobacterium suaedae]|uniref:DUF5106 domain-containing protein n=1 Tax=Sphingobacterium suaedae TaxID=1686402 RepID=A0ABW5KNQ0_9SPHI